MNKKLAVIFILLINSFCYSRDVQETFLRANKLYQDGDYQKALDLYDSIAHKGSATWYNMGNCLFNMNKQVEAIVCWKKAQRNATAQKFDDLEKNIAVACKILGKDSNIGSYSSFAESFLNRFSLYSFQLLFLALWFLFFVFLRVLKNHRRFLLFLFFPINVVLGLAIFEKYNANVYPLAIVIKPSASLFAGPDKEYHVVGKVTMIDKVKVLERRDDWCKVQAKRLAGWALADTIEII